MHGWVTCVQFLKDGLILILNLYTYSITSVTTAASAVPISSFVNRSLTIESRLIVSCSTSSGMTRTRQVGQLLFNNFTHSFCYVLFHITCYLDK